MKRIIIFIIFLIIFSFGANAESEDTKTASDFGGDDLLNALPDETRNLLNESEITPDNAGALSITPFTVLNGLWRVFADEVTKPLKMLAALTGIILLCAVSETLRDGAAGSGNPRMASDAFGIVGVLAGAGMMIVYISDSVARAVQTLDAAAVFLMTFVPIFAGIMAVCGQLTTASVFGASVVVAGQVFAYITTGLLAPLVSCILGVSTAGAVNPDLKIDRLAETVKKIVVWTLGLLVTVFTGLLSLQSLVSSAADSVALKAMKFTVSNSVPIVGGAVSDALSTVRGSLNLLRGSTGTFGIIAGLALIVPTLVSVFCHKLALSLAAAICDIFGVNRLSTLLKSGENVMTIIFAMLFCFTLVLIISVAMMLIIWNGNL
ncbi:MAG: stage III sporulation protein AE [Oscillospiraceae bacterium]|nr:stage III sporulation protein AE [Oscillospiraceae bacterium]